MEGLIQRFVDFNQLSRKSNDSLKMLMNWLCLFIVLFWSQEFHVTAVNIPRRKISADAYVWNPCKADSYIGDIAISDELPGSRLDRQWSVYRGNDTESGLSSPVFNNRTRRSQSNEGYEWRLKLLEEKHDIRRLIKEVNTELTRPCNNSINCSQERHILHKLLDNAKARRGEIKHSLLQLKRDYDHQTEHESDGSADRKILHRKRRGATSDRSRLWDNAVIPFVIEEGLYKGETKELFYDAMRHWMEKTCLVFKQAEPSDVNYVIIRKEPCGCCSHVGKKGGPQVLSLQKGCYYRWIIIHEMGHVVGFWHEHQRPDRDRYINILDQNILPGKKSDFAKKSEDDVNSLGMPYDYDSIMHYSRNKFTKHDILDTIVPKPRPGIIGIPSIGRRRMSEGDVKQTNKLYNCPKCGRTMMESSGAIDLNPASNREQTCEWRILVSMGSRVRLTFTRLDMRNCRDNYVEVRDGHFHHSPKLGTFCNQRNPAPVESSLNWMWIQYKSGIGHSGGFHADFEAVCGGELSGPRGVVESPGYPSNYLPDSDCQWIISVRTGYRVVLKFDIFKTEAGEDGDCDWDYLEIRDGPSESSPLIGKYCDNDRPEDIMSLNNHLFVKFFSDDSEQEHGFTAEYFEEIDECETGNHGCSFRCINTIGSFECTCAIGETLHSDGKQCEKDCGGRVEPKRNGTGFIKGRLSSPSHPDLYPGNRTCQWRFVAPEGYKWIIDFDHMDIEKGELESGCSRDYVSVSNVQNQRDRLQGKYCGDFMVPDRIISLTNELKIEFHSDETLQQTGFSLEYIADKDECAEYNGGCQKGCENTVGSFECTCPEDWILNADKKTCKENKDECATNNGGCEKGCKKTVGSFECTCPEDWYLNPDKRTCTQEIDECETGNHGCQHVCINTVHSFECTCKIGWTLHSDGKQCEEDCGGYIQPDKNGSLLEVGRLSSPSYPELYPLNKLCKWHFVAPEGYNWIIDFDVMKIEGAAGQECEDYVKVSNVVSQKDDPVGQYCGDEVPQRITSLTNELRVEFHSDDSVQEKGFSLEYIADKDECAENNGGCQKGCKNTVGSFECTCPEGWVLNTDRKTCKERSGCFKEIKKDRGFINSPRWPRKYPSRQDCEWRFSTLHGHQVRLNFTHFDVEPHKTCRYDHVSVYDGPDIEAPLIGEMCGTNRPSPVISSGNKLSLAFYSDGSVQRKGFRARHDTVCSPTLEATKVSQKVVSHIRFNKKEYPNRQNCSWSMEAPQGSHVHLQFLKFDVEAEATCGYDYVKIYDGKGRYEKSLGTFCGKKLPPTIVSRTRHLRVVFKSDDTLRAPGFSFNYKIADRQTG